MTKSTLELKDGYLSIKCVDTDYSEPFFLVRWYPCFKCNGYDGQFFPIGECMVPCSNPGVYRCADINKDGRFFELEHLGQTRPIAFEKIPIAQPKSAKRVRWHYGQFQKLLKTGWVTLPISWPACTPQTTPNI